MVDKTFDEIYREKKNQVKAQTAYENEKAFNDAVEEYLKQLFEEYIKSR